MISKPGTGDLIGLGDFSVTLLLCLRPNSIIPLINLLMHFEHERVKSSSYEILSMLVNEVKPNKSFSIATKESIVLALWYQRLLLP